MRFLLVTIIPFMIFSLNAAYAEIEQDKSIFDLLMNSPEELLSELDIPETSAGDELEPQLTITPTSCKEGLTLVIKAADGSPKCVKPTTMFNLMERNWIIVREAFAQSDDANETEKFPAESEQAMFYSVRASGGILQKEIVGNFHKFTPYTSEEPHITPDNPVDKRTKMNFALESLPSKDKIEFYRFVGKIMQQDPVAREPIDVNVDIVAGDGTVIQTWAYRNCEIQNYVTYLQDTVFFYQFSGEQKSEIRDRTLVQCSALDLEVPE